RRALAPAARSLPDLARLCATQAAAGCTAADRLRPPRGRCGPSAGIAEVPRDIRHLPPEGRSQSLRHRTERQLRLLRRPAGHHGQDARALRRGRHTRLQALRGQRRGRVEALTLTWRARPTVFASLALLCSQFSTTKCSEERVTLPRFRAASFFTLFLL